MVNVQYEPYDVYIGRGRCPRTKLIGKWGNPFSHKADSVAQFKVSTRKQAIEFYSQWIQNQPELLAAIPELKDKTLGCWCKPKDGFKGKILCHGQILASLCYGIPPQEID